MAPENKARQAMYVYHYIQARVCNVCCRAKAKSITYTECVFVTFGIQHAMCIIVLHVACLAHSIFPHHINSMIKKKKSCWT